MDTQFPVKKLEITQEHFREWPSSAFHANYASNSSQPDISVHLSEEKKIS